MYVKCLVMRLYNYWFYLIFMTSKTTHSTYRGRGGTIVQIHLGHVGVIELQVNPCIHRIRSKETAGGFSTNVLKLRLKYILTVVLSQ